MVFGLFAQVWFCGVAVGHSFWTARGEGTPLVDGGGAWDIAFEDDFGALFFGDGVWNGDG